MIGSRSMPVLFDACTVQFLRPGLPELTCEAFVAEGGASGLRILDAQSHATVQCCNGGNLWGIWMSIRTRTRQN